MKITQMLNNRGNAWANQFVVRFDSYNIEILQSYNSKVVLLDFGENHITFGDDWNYSNTTRRAVYKFLGDNIGELPGGKAWNGDIIKKALESGELVDRYGNIWTVAPACDDYFEDFFKGGAK